MNRFQRNSAVHRYVCTCDTRILLKHCCCLTVNDVGERKSQCAPGGSQQEPRLALQAAAYINQYRVHVCVGVGLVACVFR